MLFIDFETYSAVDIKKAGGKAYAHDESTQIVCMGYAFDQEEPSLWTVANGALPEKVVEHVKSGGKMVAFNATFDFRIWNCVGVRDFNWPVLSLEQVIDAQALCATYQIPQNLAAAGEALRVPMPKDKMGNALIKQCCVPDRNGDQPLPYGTLGTAFKNLFLYCLRDVKAMQQIVYLLPRQELIPQEQEIWKMTYRMNERGLPIDVESVQAIYTYLQDYIAKTVVELPMITDGKVTTPGQIARIQDWCKAQGYPVNNLQAETVEYALEDDMTPPKVRRVLELRQELGRSSTAKYAKILDQVVGDTIYDNLRYHGAGPGRWTGQGFQMHNLPRASVEDPEEWIAKFKQNLPMENPVGIAKALIRPMIRAPKGYKILVVDYSSIENRLLAWAADDQGTLQDFADGKDQYITMASARFGVPYEQVTKEQRRVGKVIILGCGYGMGAKKFRATAKLQAKLELSDAEALASVNAYRDRYPKVKLLWNNLRRVAAEAVISGQKRTYKGVVFGTFVRNGIRWLAMKLPTGKALYYMNPSIKEELIKDYEFMGPVPCITHEGMDPYKHKWSRLKLIPGRITENFIQATAREVMAYGMRNVEEHMPHLKLIGTVHDEALALVREELDLEDNLQRFMHALCDVDFVPGCPITSAGFITDRYRKD